MNACESIGRGTEWSWEIFLMIILLMSQKERKNLSEVGPSQPVLWTEIGESCCVCCEGEGEGWAQSVGVGVR